jgi:hypothetical protein
LLKFAAREATPVGRYGKGTLVFAGASGLLTTSLGMALAFFPAKQITSLWKYEVQMLGVTLGFVALAVFFFFIYSRLKAPAAAATAREDLRTARST